MLARDGRIIADDVARCAFSLQGVTTDASSGQTDAERVIYVRRHGRR